MGNVFSSDLAREEKASSISERDIMMASTSEDNSESQEFHDAIDEIDDRNERIKVREAEMEEFRRQLEIKREQRRGILDRHKTEKKELEVSLYNERKAKLEYYETNKALRELLVQNNVEIPESLDKSKENSDLTNTIINIKEEFETLKSNNNQLRKDLADSNLTLQGAYSDIADLHKQNTESMKQINALKEVVAVSKTMLGLRENQLDELKTKLSEIERSLADREANMLSADLRQEYERQLQNIRSLRTLYEERARLAEVTRQGLLRELEEQKSLKKAETEKVQDLTSKVQQLEARVNELQETILNKNNQIYTCQDETRGLKTEMSAVNKLFSQVLLGYKNQQDLDTLVHRLEENHGILTHMAENENDSEASTALPKLLLEIVSQVDEEERKTKNVGKEAKFSESVQNPEAEQNYPTNTTAAEIVQNLPKVWRVLIELLSHQTTADENEIEKVTTCYKTVETKTGPVLVPSVSQTYIRLKDLIVEKLGLVKEVNRMKQLNGHLETRLEEQERRLCLVTNELSKTWHVVGRLRRHHHQLHTHEKILKYELQQKRKLLTELKEELEYCREKWDQAREKNSQSEKDWRKLRAEFSSRNAKSFNNSAESGYSDERPSDHSSESNDESEYVTEPLIRPKKKLKKSFETILDSSTDRNLAAEREDPASDMLDVAELPLDTQEGEDHLNVSDSQDSKSSQRCEICETEDEVGDITHDSCTEDYSNPDLGQRSDHLNETKNNYNSTPNNVDSKIEENEIQEKRGDSIEQLEKTEKERLNQIESEHTVTKPGQKDTSFEHFVNSPSSSKQGLIENATSNATIFINKQSNKDVTATEQCVDDYSDDLSNLKQKESLKTMLSGKDTAQTLDFKAILESVKAQNDRLSKKDERLQKLEAGCSEIVNKITETVNAEQKMIEKLDMIHNSRSEKIEQHILDDSLDDQNNIRSKPSTSNDQSSTILKLKSETKHGFQELYENNSNISSNSNRDYFEQSTSGEVNHEALFAARDLRFKLLEEQTKSLVNKVNKTTDKGIKINYKLEELHNIYGSENSRAGTPSSNDDKDKESDENSKVSDEKMHDNEDDS